MNELSLIEACELGGWSVIWKGFWLASKVLRVRETRYFFVLEFHLPNHSKASAEVGSGFVFSEALKGPVEDESARRHCQGGSNKKKKSRRGTGSRRGSSQVQRWIFHPPKEYPLKDMEWELSDNTICVWASDCKWWRMGLIMLTDWKSRRIPSDTQLEIFLYRARGSVCTEVRWPWSSPVEARFGKYTTEVTVHGCPVLMPLGQKLIMSINSVTQCDIFLY